MLSRTQQAVTLTLGVQSPELWGETSLLYKSPSVWCFVIGNQTKIVMKSAVANNGEANPTQLVYGLKIHNYLQAGSLQKRKKKQSNPRLEQKQWDWNSVGKSDVLGIKSIRILIYGFRR